VIQLLQSLALTLLEEQQGVAVRASASTRPQGNPALERDSMSARTSRSIQDTQ